MNKLYDYIERIREQTTADELNTRTSKHGLTFIFGWTTERPMWWFQRHYGWGDIYNAPAKLIYNDLIQRANAEWEQHQAALLADAYKAAMGAMK